MIDFLNELTKWILYFFIYAFAGWVWECIFCSLKAKKIHFINRGFLVGPICPIYGFGCVLGMLVGQWISLPIYLEFFYFMVIGGVIEYFGSFLMEKMFHVRWWDYTDRILNLNGRISAGTCLAFGTVGVVVKHLIHPHIVGFVEPFSFKFRLAASAILLAIILMDYYFSTMAAFNVKHALKGGRVDLTEEIKKFTINYYKKQTRRTRKIARDTIKRMKKAQKRAIKEFRKTQKQLKKTLKLEQKQAIAKSDLKTIKKKSSKLKDNSKVNF